MNYIKDLSSFNCHGFIYMQYHKNFKIINEDNLSLKKSVEDVIQLPWVGVGSIIHYVDDIILSENGEMVGLLITTCSLVGNNY